MGILGRIKQKLTDTSDPFADNDALEAYLGGRFREVTGWLSGDAMFPIKELSKQQIQAGLGGGVAEIGVHHGQLFIYLSLLTAPGERAVGFDLFERQDENTDGSGEGDRDIVERNIVNVGADPARIELVTTNSLDVTPDQVKASIGGPARLFSVDGGHTPELTKHDLEIAAGSLVDGGVIILDDVFSQMWPGVSEGLRDFMTAHDGRLAPFGLIGNKTLLTQPEHQADYLAVLDDMAKHFWTRKDSYYGSDVRILLDPA